MPERARPIQDFSKAETHPNGRVGRGTLPVGPESIVIRQTLDFPLGDGWSKHKGNVIELRRARGDFLGRNGEEAGVGDGRNALRAGVHVEAQKADVTFTGIDIDAWRAAQAHLNLVDAGVPLDNLTILVGGAVNDQLARTPYDAQDGYVFGCLPQAPMGETHNRADGIDTQRDNLEGGRNLDIGPYSVDEYGLILNAAYLRALRENVTDTADVQMTFSGRIPTDVVSRLFAQTGWDLREVYKTKEPVLQDRDTGVAYVSGFGDQLDSARGEGFFTKTESGMLVPMIPDVAESRRKEAEATDGALNVYHHVSEYVAVPTENVHNRTRGPVTVYEI